MKKTFAVWALSALSLGAMAQNTVIKISGTRLAYPLFQHWADAYSASHPGVQFVINSSLAADSSDIVIASYSVQPSELKPGKQLLAVSRYVQLPIVNSQRKDIAALQQKGFTSADFLRIYFSAAEQKNDAFGGVFSVYTREKPACATKAFAAHFGNATSDIKGKGISGDDKTLLDAVKNDVNAISYNNAGFIYNHQTRKPVDSIAIVPVDLNENGRIDATEKIYNTVDDVIAFAEKTNHPKLLIENVNVIVDQSFRVAAVKDFLQWIILNGQLLAHQTGFLQLRDAQVEDEQAILASAANADPLDALYGKQD